MQFQYFSEEFLNKWLKPNDFITYTSLNDRKLQAGINWLTAIQKTSFQRYNLMWLDMKDKCLDCMKTNCNEDYQWIINNSEQIPNENNEGFKKIKFSDKVTGKIGYDKIKNYYICKQKCYEKVNIMNSTLTKKFRSFSHEFNICLVLCRGKPFDKENILSDCYSDCMINHSKLLPNIEYYIRTMYEKMIKEYKENNINTPNVDLLHNQRFKEREFTEDLWKKYL